MNIGNILIALAYVTLICTVLSFYWDRYKRNKEHNKAIKEARAEINKLNEEISSLKKKNEELNKIRTMFKPAKPIQLVIAKVNIDNAALQSQIEVLLAEKKVWEEEGLKAAELIRQRNEQINNLEYNLGIKDSEIEKLIAEHEIFLENLPADLKPTMEKLKQEKHFRYNLRRSKVVEVL